MKKPVGVDATVLMDFKKLAAKVYDQSGIRLNAEQALKSGDSQSLRVWEQTFQAKGDRFGRDV